MIDEEIDSSEEMYDYSSECQGGNHDECEDDDCECDCHDPNSPMNQS
jgi:hypothetical protein